MTVLPILLLCVGSNIDNLSAAVVLGLRSVVIPLSRNVLIGAVTAVGTYVAMSLGTVVTDRVSQTAVEIGAVALVAIGIGTIVRGWHASTFATRATMPESERRAVQSRLSVRAAFGLAIALAINNVISGVGAGAAGLSPLWTALVSGLVSVVFVACGDRLASRLAILLTPRRCALLAGVLLVIVGVVELVA
jgi:putative Mn2+ efflux pump MntP